MNQALPCIILTISVILQTTLAKPTMRIVSDSVSGSMSATVPWCRPLTQDDLIRIMGGAWDPRRMSTTATGEPYPFQRDDPRAVSFDDGVDSSRPVGGVHVKRKLRSRRRRHRRYNSTHRRKNAQDMYKDSHVGGVMRNLINSTDSATKATMPAHSERRRRSLHNQTRLIHQNIIVGGHLKEDIRGNGKVGSRLPWACVFRKFTHVLKNNYFPPVLTDGICGYTKEEQSCFYSMYRCRPQFYFVNVLKKDANHCNPIPSLSNSTVYEERWNIAYVKVTIGCNCEKG